MSRTSHVLIFTTSPRRSAAVPTNRMCMLRASLIIGQARLSSAMFTFCTRSFAKAAADLSRSRRTKVDPELCEILQLLKGSWVATSNDACWCAGASIDATIFDLSRFVGSFHPLFQCCAGDLLLFAQNMSFS